MASSHEQTIIDILPYLCLLPPTLDGSRFPRRDVGGTGEISEGWLASTELKPKTIKVIAGPKGLWGRYVTRDTSVTEHV